MTDKGRTGDELAGETAERPSDISKRGWWQITRRAWRESKADNVPILAGGVAFFGFLALFPALIAGLTLWGLVTGPEQAATQAESLTDSLPADAARLITDQMETIASTGHRGLGLGVALSVLLALWSASGGMGNLVKAVNLAYHEQDDRGLVKARALSLLLTLGAIVFMVITFSLVALVPALLDRLGLGAPGTLALQILRWALLVVVMVLALAVLYRVGPSRSNARMRWVSSGALIATALWVLASIGFSLYASNLGSYDKTYGAIAGVAILMLWLWLTAFAVLLGAEVNAESERQTRTDTTTGPPQPLGRRGAYAADTVAAEARD